MSGLKENLLAVEARIRAACDRSGRDPSGVRLVWVSKNHPRERLIEALELGARIFGENRVQEVLEKFPLPPSREKGNAKDTPGIPDAAAKDAPQLHFIGRLQKNKIRKVLPLASAFHSIDSLDLLAAVDRVAGELGVVRDVFLQVNTSREAAKGGFEPDVFSQALADLPTVPNLRIVGLMTMGPIETAAGAPAGAGGGRAGLRGRRRRAPVSGNCRGCSRPTARLRGR
jgi:uncharacterized pyridoxal phosphate-containing UPF0001 family protein